MRSLMYTVTINMLQQYIAVYQLLCYSVTTHVYTYLYTICHVTNIWHNNDLYCHGKKFWDSTSKSEIFINKTANIIYNKSHAIAGTTARWMSTLFSVSVCWLMINYNILSRRAMRWDHAVAQTDFCFGGSGAQLPSLPPLSPFSLRPFSFFPSFPFAGALPLKSS